MLQAHDSIAAGDFTSVDTDDEHISEQLLINLDKKPEECDSGEIVAVENYNTYKNKHVSISDNAGDNKITAAPTITVDHELSSNSDESEEIDDTDGSKMKEHSDMMNTVAFEDTRNDNTDMYCWDLPASNIKESAFQPATTDNTINNEMHVNEEFKDIPVEKNDIKEELIKEIDIEEPKMDGMMDGMMVQVTDNAVRTVRMFRNAKESLVSIYYKGNVNNYTFFL